MKFLQKRKPGSLFKRFFVLTTVTVLISFVVANLSLMFFLVSFWKEDRFTSLSDDALSLARSVELICKESGPDFLYSKADSSSTEAIASALSTISELSSVDPFIVDINGNVILCKDNLELGNVKCIVHELTKVDKSIISHSVNDFPQAYRYEGKIAESDAQGYFVACVPVDYKGEPVAYVVNTQLIADAYLPYTTEFVRMFLSTGFIAVIFTLIASAVTSFRMVKPLKIMTDTTKKYAKGDFGQRIKSVETYGELQELVDAFNSMADSLAVTEESRVSFVANVSHELKTPMTIINGFVDGILDGTISDCDKEKYLTIVSDETKRLSRLVVAMLNMSKIEAGRLSITPTPIQLRNVICNTIVGFEMSVSEKNISVTGLDYLDDVSINADEALINQVLYNLIDNAVKFTPERGNISFALYQEKKHAVLSIRNTGKGIPKEECELVFDRFYKVDKSRGLDASSFGLGLHIVRSIIELHNGTISINSEENKFTEFILKFPLE